MTVYIGFSDAIYAEAYVKVHGFDIMLGIFLGRNLRPNVDLIACNQMSSWSTRRRIRYKTSASTLQRSVT